MDEYFRSVKMSRDEWKREVKRLNRRPGAILHRAWWRVRKFFRSLDNYRRGFAFGYVRRCRVCDHTAYYPDHCG